VIVPANETWTTAAQGLRARSGEGQGHPPQGRLPVGRAGPVTLRASNAAGRTRTGLPQLPHPRGLPRSRTIAVLATRCSGCSRLLRAIRPDRPEPRAVAGSSSDLRQRFGLDRPILEQYLRYMGNWHRQLRRVLPPWPAGDPDLGERLNDTVALMLPALVLATFSASRSGPCSPGRRGSWPRLDGTTGAMVFRSRRSSGLSIIFIAVFSVRLGLAPSGHMRTPGTEPGGVIATFVSLDFLGHLALPMLMMTAYYGCYSPARDADVHAGGAGEDFIDLCQAKGLPERRIVFGHALRASLLPIATSVSLLAAYVVAGSVLVETVFSWPGLGRLMVQAVTDSGLSSGPGVLLPDRRARRARQPARRSAVRRARPAIRRQ